MCCQVKSWSHYHFLGDPCISLLLCEEAKKTVSINKRICGKLASPDQFFWHPFLIELVPHKYCLHPSLNLAFRWLQQEGSSREAKKSNVLPVSCCTEFSCFVRWQNLPLLWVGVVSLCLQAALSVVPVPGLSGSVPDDLQPLLFHGSHLRFLVGAEPVLCTLILLHLFECYWSP